MQKTRINISHATPRPTVRNTNVSEKLPLYTASLCTRNKSAKASRTAQDNFKALFEPLIWSNANILYKKQTHQSSYKWLRLTNNWDDLTYCQEVESRQRRTRGSTTETHSFLVTG